MDVKGNNVTPAVVAAAPVGPCTLTLDVKGYIVDIKGYSADAKGNNVTPAVVAAAPVGQFTLALARLTLGHFTAAAPLAP